MKTYAFHLSSVTGWLYLGTIRAKSRHQAWLKVPEMHHQVLHVFDNDAEFSRVQVLLAHNQMVTRHARMTTV